MCQFNFIALKETSNEAKITELALKSDIALRPVMLRMKIQGLRIFATSKTDCDCASIFGKTKIDQYNFDPGKERKKLERKRFSKNRLESLLTQLEMEFYKSQDKKKFKEDIEGNCWKRFAQQIRNANIGEVGIFYKQFKGSISEENINETEIIFKAEITSKFLKEMDEEKIYWIASASR